MINASSGVLLSPCRSLSLARDAFLQLFATFLDRPKKGGPKKGARRPFLIRPARSSSVHFRNSPFEQVKRSGLGQSEMLDPRTWSQPGMAAWEFPEDPRHPLRLSLRLCGFARDRLSLLLSPFIALPFFARLRLCGRPTCRSFPAPTQNPLDASPASLL
jgi:hypothetical protein